ncbi:unnamed protein product, partial [Nesidiocoris tenuis]
GKHRNHSADRGPAQDKGSNDKGDYDPIVLIIPFDMNYEPTVGIDSEQKRKKSYRPPCPAGSNYTTTRRHRRNGLNPSLDSISTTNSGNLKSKRSLKVSVVTSPHPSSPSAPLESYPNSFASGAGADETFSLVSDTWSTDVLASDSELLEQQPSSQQAAATLNLLSSSVLLEPAAGTTQEGKSSLPCLDQERFPTYGDRVTGLCTMSQIDQEKKARTASRASFTRIKNQIVIGIENVAPNLRALAKVFDDSFEELNKRDGVVQELMKMDMTITEEDMIEDQEKSDEYSLMYYEIKFKAAEILDNESYSVM